VEESSLEEIVSGEECRDLIEQSVVIGEQREVDSDVKQV
jgi:hypothetical protein